MASKIFARFCQVPEYPSAASGGLHAGTAQYGTKWNGFLFSRRCFDTESADFDYITLFREEVIVAVAAFHPLAHRPKNTSMEFPQVSPEGLCDSPFILMSPGSTIRAISDYIFHQAAFSYRGI
ncbi:MAG: hypothetical protein V8S58_11290 [Lachnospiraceae bacterium]